MNTYPLGGEENRYVKNQAKLRGAKMIFKWHGPVITTTTDKILPWLAGHAHDERYHRIFIPHGTYEHLSLIDIQLVGDGNWADTLDYPAIPGLSTDGKAWQNYLASKNSRWSEKKILDITCAVNDLKTHPRTIKVVDARRMPFHSH